MFRFIKNRIGSFLGYGGCVRCRDSWWWKKEHNIPVHCGGMFPLCEECWQKTTRNEKIDAVKQLAVKWQREKPLDNYHTQLIQEAIKFVENDGETK